MTGKEFFSAVANGRADVVRLLLSLLEQTGSDYCLIDGLAVNAYAEPVVSLDVDLVVVAGRVRALCEAARSSGFKVEPFEHRINLSLAGSDLRIQLQTDERYQEFIARGARREVIGYTMRVAALEDVLRGKVWAYCDQQRRRSKRQEDLSDILRLVETHPQLKDLLPPEIKSQVQ